jgi:hypothetical protein
MDERRRYSRSRRPSDESIRLAHNELAEPVETDDDRSSLAHDLNDAGGEDAAENTSVQTPPLEDQDARSPERERVLRAARRVLSGRGRSRARASAAPTRRVSEHDRVAEAVGRPSPADESESASVMLGMSLSPEARERVAEADEQRQYVELSQGQTFSKFGTEKFFDLGGLQHVSPHWSERDETRGRRYQDPDNTSQE